MTSFKTLTKWIAYSSKKKIQLVIASRYPEYPELVNINMPEKMIISEEIKNLIEIHSMKFQI